MQGEAGESVCARGAGAALSTAGRARTGALPCDVPQRRAARRLDRALLIPWCAAGRAPGVRARRWHPLTAGAARARAALQLTNRSQAQASGSPSPSPWEARPPTPRVGPPCRNPSPEAHRAAGWHRGGAERAGAAETAGGGLGMVVAGTDAAGLRDALALGQPTIPPMVPPPLPTVAPTRVPTVHSLTPSLSGARAVHQHAPGCGRDRARLRLEGDRWSARRGALGARVGSRAGGLLHAGAVLSARAAGRARRRGAARVGTPVRLTVYL